MKKLLCDRCEKEIIRQGIHMKTGCIFFSSFIPKKDYDLCPECSEKFHEFLANKT